ncbi:MAG TPA: aminoacyl-tRNA hydrolase [Verrucomicrobiae bacterium]
MHLIAGLGNPGPDYAATRHNIGFVLAERLAERWRGVWRLEKKFQARVARVELGGRKVILAQPQTFMNDSGEAVAAIGRFYQLAPERILIAVDDADLPVGQLRMRADGSSGGHHGLESVERQLGTRGYPRLRLGIGRKSEVRREITGYVLGCFEAAERKTMDEVLGRAAEQAECWLDEGASAAMNKFNGAVTAPPEKGKQ